MPGHAGPTADLVERRAALLAASRRRLLTPGEQAELDRLGRVLDQRASRLPGQFDRARRRVEALERDARLLALVD